LKKTKKKLIKDERTKKKWTQRRARESWKEQEEGKASKQANGKRFFMFIFSVLCAKKRRIE